MACNNKINSLIQIKKLIFKQLLLLIFLFLNPYKYKKVVYLFNFLSWFVQIPALYGKDGLQPIFVKNLIKKQSLFFCK